MADPGFDVVLREVAVRGGGDAELCLTRTRDRRYEAREGRLDGIALADTVALGLRVFRSGRMGFSYGFRGDAADLAGKSKLARAAFGDAVIEFYVHHARLENEAFNNADGRGLEQHAAQRLRTLRREYEHRRGRQPVRRRWGTCR